MHNDEQMLVMCQVAVLLADWKLRVEDFVQLQIVSVEHRFGSDAYWRLPFGKLLGDRMLLLVFRRFRGLLLAFGGRFAIEKRTTSRWLIHVSIHVSVVVQRVVWAPVHSCFVLLGRHQAVQYVYAFLVVRHWLRFEYFFFFYRIWNTARKSICI